MNEKILQELVDKNLSTRKIAEELGISQTTTRHWLNKFELKTKKHINKTNCLNCDKEFKFKKSNSSVKYCSNKCQSDFEYKTITLINFKAGKIYNRPTLRKILGREIKEECFECGINEWNNKPLILEVDHIDGNAANNMPNNLRLLCPNCHSQTETSCGKNRGNGRKSRGLALNK